MAADRPRLNFTSSLARYLLIAYALLIVYASLYPWSGWRAQGVHPFAFMLAPLPHYRTAFDIVTNLLAYAPLGFLAVVAAPSASTRAVVFAAAFGAVLSFALESLQTYLPTRVSSNLDLLLNAVGSTLGAIAAVAAMPRLLAAGGSRALRHLWFRDGPRVDFGLLLIGLWLFTQLNPETLLFGGGDLRELIGTLPSKPYPAALFVRVEAFVVAANLMVVGLMLASFVRPPRSALPLVGAVFVAALATRSVAFAVLFQPASAFAWLTPGAAIGFTLGLGGVALMTALPLSSGIKLGLAALLITLAAVVVNVEPQNPYLADSLAGWRQGHFLNFNGLTRGVSVAWPFLVMIFLFSGERRSGSRDHPR